MALSVVKRPLGFKLGTTAYSATWTDNSSVLTTAAAPSTGAWIYITANQYTGFWYVTNLSGTTFSISEYATASAKIFSGSGGQSFTYYAVADPAGHGWCAVHLPIVYKLKSTLWPTNSVDTARTVSSFANDNGYTKLTLSGALLASLSELEFVKITGIQEAGIYQILNWYSTSVVTINLPYNAALAFGGGTVQYYYNNYRAKVRLYAGLNTNQYFSYLKPWTLVVEREIVPDSNGIVTFNCNEDLKSFVNILSNNLTLGSLPNNLDAFCQFYITYAEAYDYSAGGYGLLDYVGSYTDDSNAVDYIKTYAVNASLPFKNIYSGYLSDYVYQTGVTGKFLTPTLYPVHFNNYFDLSFIKTVDANVYIRFRRYINSVLQSTSYTAVSDYGFGVYREQISLTGNEDRVDVDWGVLTALVQAGASWTNNGAGTSWVFSSAGGNTPPTATPYSSKQARGTFAGQANGTYTFTFAILTTTGTFTYSIGFLDSGGTATGSAVTGSSNFSGTITLTAGANAPAYIAISASATSGVNPIMQYTLPILLTWPDADITAYSETKQITVDTSCTPDYIDMSWLNYLGGFDYWRFRGFADYGADITETKETTKNILPTWPNSYGEGADTIRFETTRKSNQSILVRAENLTADQVNDLYRIKLSPLVQIVNTASDRRTVIPDKSSFVYYPQMNKLFTLSFTITYTDENPVQSL